MTDSKPARRKKVRLKDVARQAEISIGTASMACRGSERISRETRLRVAQVCRELGYVPPVRPEAVMPAERNETRIGLALVGGSVHDIIYAQVLHVFSSAAHDSGFRLQVQTIEPPLPPPGQLLQRILSFAEPCDGLLLCGHVTTSLLRELDACHPRVAFLGWPILDASHSGQADERCPGRIIAGDDQAMGRFATQRLLHAGYRRIAFVAEVMPPGCSHAKWLEGYRLAMIDAEGVSSHVRITGSGAAAILRSVGELVALAEPPEAFVVTDVTVAAALSRELAAAGRPVPADAMIVWGNPTIAAHHGMADRPMLEIDAERWIQSALRHVLEAPERMLPSCVQVLIPFVTHNLPELPGTIQGT